MCIDVLKEAQTHFKYRYRSGAYSTRLSEERCLVIPNLFSTHCKKSVRWVGGKLWNGLPREMRSPNTYTDFKRKVKALPNEHCWERT